MGAQRCQGLVGLTPQLQQVHLSVVVVIDTHHDPLDPVVIVRASLDVRERSGRSSVI